MKSKRLKKTLKELKTKNLTAKERLDLGRNAIDELGLIVKQLEADYVAEACNFAEGQKVYYREFTEKWKCGVIHLIKHDRSYGFYYHIKPKNANWAEPNRIRSLTKVEPGRWGLSHGIRKAEEGQLV